MYPSVTVTKGAYQFVTQFCTKEGHSLRVNEEGKIVIGVPEWMSEAEYDAIAEQIELMDDAIKQILQEGM